MERKVEEEREREREKGRAGDRFDCLPAASKDVILFAHKKITHVIKREQEKKTDRERERKRKRKRKKERGSAVSLSSHVFA